MQKNKKQTKLKPVILAPGQSVVFRMQNRDLHVGRLEMDEDDQIAFMSFMEHPDYSNKAGESRIVTLRFFLPRAENPDS